MKNLLGFCAYQLNRAPSAIALASDPNAIPKLAPLDLLLYTKDCPLVTREANGTIVSIA
jgi:hypothetical protein